MYEKSNAIVKMYNEWFTYVTLQGYTVCCGYPNVSS